MSAGSPIIKHDHCVIFQGLLLLFLFSIAAVSSEKATHSPVESSAGHDSFSSCPDSEGLWRARIQELELELDTSQRRLQSTQHELSLLETKLATETTLNTNNCDQLQAKAVQEAQSNATLECQAQLEVQQGTAQQELLTVRNELQQQAKQVEQQLTLTLEEQFRAEWEPQVLELNERLTMSLEETAVLTESLEALRQDHDTAVDTRIQELELELESTQNELSLMETTTNTNCEQLQAKAAQDARNNATQACQAQLEQQQDTAQQELMTVRSELQQQAKQVEQQLEEQFRVEWETQVLELKEQLTSSLEETAVLAESLAESRQDRDDAVDRFQQLEIEFQQQQEQFQQLEQQLQHQAKQVEQQLTLTLTLEEHFRSVWETQVIELKERLTTSLEETAVLTENLAASRQDHDTAVDRFQQLEIVFKQQQAQFENRLQQVTASHNGLASELESVQEQWESAKLELFHVRRDLLRADEYAQELQDSLLHRIVATYRHGFAWTASAYRDVGVWTTAAYRDACAWTASAAETVAKQSKAAYVNTKRLAVSLQHTVGPAIQPVLAGISQLLQDLCRRVKQGALTFVDWARLQIASLREWTAKHARQMAQHLQVQHLWELTRGHVSHYIDQAWGHVSHYVNQAWGHVLPVWNHTYTTSIQPAMMFVSNAMSTLSDRLQGPLEILAMLQAKLIECVATASDVFLAYLKLQQAPEFVQKATEFVNVHSELCVVYTEASFVTLMILLMLTTVTSTVSSSVRKGSNQPTTQQQTNGKKKETRPVLTQ